MEKFGVVTEQDPQKVASLGERPCPTCGSKVERRGNIIACVKCGTKPFEKKK